MDTYQAITGGPLIMLKKAASVGFVKSPNHPEVGIVGYNMHKRAVLAIGLNALKGGEKRILAFGLPGSGVERFPHAVISDLQRKLGIQVSLAYISCDNLLLSSKISEVLENTSKKINEAIEKNIEERGLVFVLIDNIDALSNKYENFHEKKKLIIPWLTSILRKKYDRAILFCTSDDPSSVEIPMMDSFEYPIYLRYLDVDSLVTVIRAYLRKREDAQQIAFRLYDEMENRRKMKLVSAEVLKALQTSIADAPDLETCSTEKAVTTLRDHVWPCYPKDCVEDYERKNSDFISRSEEAVKRWAEVLKLYLGSEGA